MATEEDRIGMYDKEKDCDICGSQGSFETAGIWICPRCIRQSDEDDGEE